MSFDVITIDCPQMNAFLHSPKRPTPRRRPRSTPAFARPPPLPSLRASSLIISSDYAAPPHDHRPTRTCSLLTYPKSKKKLSVTSSGSPRRTHILLTPPLTPSSSFNSASGTESSDRDNDADSFLPSTPPPPDSPLRSAWNAAGGKFRNVGPFGNNVYLSPVSGDSDIGDPFPSRLRRIQSSSNVGSASPDGSAEITPRVEKTFALNSTEQGLSERAIEILMTFKGVVDPTPFVLVRAVPYSYPG